MGISYHLTFLLRNLYAGQEVTVRMRHGTMDWFQIGKGVRQGCILSPCLFNLHVEYITRNAGLDEAQPGIKFARRNINNVRYADDMTLIQFTSVAQSFMTPCAPWAAACQASLSTTNSCSLLKLMFIESVMPSNNFILCCPLLLPLSIIPSIRVFSNESVLPIRWPKYWSFSFNISPSNKYSGLISFRFDWLDLLRSKGLSRVFFQDTVQKHQFFGTQPFLLSSSQIHT